MALVGRLAPAGWLGRVLLGHWEGASGWMGEGARKVAEAGSQGSTGTWHEGVGRGRKFNTCPGIMPMQFVPVRKRPTYAGLATVSDWVQPVARVALLTAEKL